MKTQIPLRYRALLIDRGRVYERPQQILGNNLGMVESWARKMLAKATATDATVQVYETVETMVLTIDKTVEAKPVRERERERGKAREKVRGRKRHEG